MNFATSELDKFFTKVVHELSYQDRGKAKHLQLQDSKAPKSEACKMRVRWLFCNGQFIVYIEIGR